MKKKEPGLRSSLSKNLTDSGTDLNDSSKSTSPALKCLARIAITNNILNIKIKELNTYSREDRIAKLIDEIQEIELFNCISPPDFKAFLEKLLEYEMAIQKNEIQLKQIDNMHDVDGLVLPDKMPRKIIVDCTIKELGNLLGNFTSDAKNSDGDHVFEKDCVALSEWGSLTFVKTNGTAIKPVSLLNCLGKGEETDKKDKKPPIL